MAVKLVRKSGWSKRVRERLDPQRPKYSEAVKSISAFADNIAKGGNADRVFQVLIAHLDAACWEAAFGDWKPQKP